MLLISPREVLESRRGENVDTMIWVVGYTQVFMENQGSQMTVTGDSPESAMSKYMWPMIVIFSNKVTISILSL